MPCPCIHRYRSEGECIRHQGRSFLDRSWRRLRVAGSFPTMCCRSESAHWMESVCREHRVVPDSWYGNRHSLCNRRRRGLLPASFLWLSRCSEPTRSPPYRCKRSVPDPVEVKEPCRDRWCRQETSALSFPHPPERNCHPSCDRRTGYRSHRMSRDSPRGNRSPSRCRGRWDRRRSARGGWWRRCRACLSVCRCRWGRRRRRLCGFRWWWCLGWYGLRCWCGRADGFRR